MWDFGETRGDAMKETKIETHKKNSGVKLKEERFFLVSVRETFCWKPDGKM